MKKFLAMALALLMLCMMMPVVAMAEDAVTTVSTEEELIAALKTPVSGTIELQNDITLTANWAGAVIPTGTTLIINGNPPSPSSSLARAAIPLPPPAPITPRTPAPAPMILSVLQRQQLSWHCLVLRSFSAKNNGKMHAEKPLSQGLFYCHSSPVFIQNLYKSDPCLSRTVNFLLKNV